MSCLMRKPTILHIKKLRRRSFCGNRKADQSLGIHYRDSKIPLLINLKNVILLSVFCGCASPVCVGPGRDPRLLVLTREGSYVAYFSPLYGIYLHLFCRLLDISLLMSQFYRSLLKRIEDTV